MVILVKLFGIAIVVMGGIFLVKPEIMKQYIAFWRQQKSLFIGAILSLLFGVIFLLAAPQCRLTGFIIVFGIWGIIKGVLLLTLGQNKINTYLDWWLKKPISTIRVLGLFALAIGALFSYSA